MDNRNRFGDNYDPRVVKGRMKLSVVRQLGSRVRFDDGDPPADWKATLDAGIKDHPSLGVFKSENLINVPADLVKSYVSQQALVGKDKIPIPGEKATDEDWNIVFDRLGRPKTADEYKLPELKAPEGFPDLTEKVKVFRTWAHTLGLTPKQTAGIYQKFMEAEFADYTNYLESGKKTLSDNLTSLRTDWGKAYDQNSALIHKLIANYGDEETTKYVDDSLKSDPKIIPLLKILAKIGSKMSEDGIIGKGGMFMKTPEEAKAEIAKIMGEAQNDPKHPYVNKQHPEHNIMVQKMQDLQRLAYPEKQKE